MPRKFRSRQSLGRSNCPISYALEMYGDKWSLLIVRDVMFKGKRRYGEFLDSPERIASNILAERLASLQEKGILRTEDDPGRAGALLYRLTEKGIELVPVMVEIICWSAAHDPTTAADPGFLRRARADRAALIASLQRGLRAE